MIQMPAIVLPAGIQVRTVEEGNRHLDRRDLNGRTKLDILIIMSYLREQQYQNVVNPLKLENADLKKRIENLRRELDTVALRNEREKRVRRPALIALGLFLGAPIIVATGGAALGGAGFLLTLGGVAGGVGTAMVVTHVNDKQITEIGRYMQNKKVGFVEAKAAVLRRR